MEFSRPEYWSGFPSPGDLPNPGIEAKSPILQVDFFPAEPQGKPKNTAIGSLSHHHGIFPTQELNPCLQHCMDFPGGSEGKASVYNAGDLGSIPGLERSAGEGNGNLLQYYCLENAMDIGVW